MEKVEVTGHSRGCVTGGERYGREGQQVMTRWDLVVKGRVVADVMCQDFGPAVLKYDGERIGEIQHEARSHCSVQRGGSDSGRGALARCRSLPEWRTRRRDVVTSSQPPRTASSAHSAPATAMQTMNEGGLESRDAHGPFTMP